MDPMDIYELGKQLEVVNEKNESWMFSRIKELETRIEEGKKVRQIVVDQ